MNLYMLHQKTKSHKCAVVSDKQECLLVVVCVIYLVVTLIYEEYAGLQYEYSMHETDVCL